jgi:hypothetical protein
VRFGSEKRSRSTKQRARAPPPATASGSSAATQPVTTDAARKPPEAFVGNRIEMFRFSSAIQLPDDLSDGAKVEIINSELQMLEAYGKHLRLSSIDKMLVNGRILDLRRMRTLVELRTRTQGS